MPPPKAIVCHLCNGKYFKRSFPIHLKQCEQKWKKTHSRCEYCGSAVASHDWGDHRTHCKRTNRKISKQSRNTPLQVPKAHNQQLIPTLNNQNKIIECEECETENANWKCIECEQSLCAMCEVELHRKGARSRHTRIPMSADALKQEHLSVLIQNDCKEKELNQSTINSIQTDHRAQCKFCSRRFNPERVEKHMRICSNRNKKKRKIYDGAKKRIEGTAFEEYQYNRSKTPTKVKEWKENGRRWRIESSQLREIASIRSDLKIIKKVNNKNKKCNNISDKKDDEETDIIIKAPKNKPIFKKIISKTNTPKRISGISKKSYSKFNKPKHMPLKGSSMRMKQRLSNNSNLKSRTNIKKNNISKKERNTNISNNNNRMRRRYSDTKKPAIPKFNRRKTVPNHKEMKVPIKKKSVETSTNLKNHNIMTTKNENKIKKQKPVIKRTKSEANSLPRGIDLGVNVKKVFNDEPKSMMEYVERERLRRQKRSDSKHIGMSKKSFNNEREVKKVPIKKMSRLQIKKEIKINNKPIGGRGISKPSNSKDLASKRAAYFESLLQNHD